MNTANLFLTSILLPVLTSTDNNKTKHLKEVYFHNCKTFSVADVTKVDLRDLGKRNTSEFVYHAPRLIIKAADPQLDYKKSDNRHNSKEQDVKNKFATLPDSNSVKRKKRKRELGLKIPNDRDLKNKSLEFVGHKYNKIKRKVIV